MIQVRQGVFETNSSSTHAISIGDTNYDKTFIPETIVFDDGMTFGWEFETYNDYVSKANYIWLTILGNNSDISREDKLIEYKERIREILTNAGVKNVVFKEIPYIESSWSPGRWYLDFDGYIDHYPELSFVDDLLAEPELFLSFLFNPCSEIATGNDNDDRTPQFNEKAIATYWKSN